MLTCTRTEVFLFFYNFSPFVKPHEVGWSRHANCRVRKRTKRLKNFQADILNILNTRDIRSFALIRKATIYT